MRKSSLNDLSDGAEERVALVEPAPHIGQMRSPTPLVRHPTRSGFLLQLSGLLSEVSGLT